MMHVLILPMYYPEPERPAHIGYMFYEQAMQIVKSGCKVGLCYVEQRKLSNFTWKSFRKENHFQMTEEDNGAFMTLRMHAWNPKLSTRLGGLIWSALTLILVRHYIRRYGKPDIIHAHFGMWAGYAANMIYKIYGIPYVVTEHASSINGGGTSHAQASVLKVAYKNARKIICVGTLLRKNILTHLTSSDKAIVIPNFVDTGSFFRDESYTTQKERKFTFVSIGNLSKRKGFEELIEAFSISFGGQNHVSLVIAGDGEEEENLRNQIRSLHLERQITLVGRLPRDQVARLLARSDAFVLASYAETFGIVFIEAMATGMPAIGTICGGPEDIITPENGYLLDSHDIHELADKMKELYDNYERFDKSCIRQSTIEKYDFSLIGNRLKEIYENESGCC